MPKQTLKITDFSGGMNTELNARDIKDNEWSFLSSYTGSDVGKLTLTGQFTYVTDVTSGVGVDEDTAYTSDGMLTQDSLNIPPGGGTGALHGGYGLYTFNSDYNLLSDNNSVFTPTNIIAVFGHRGDDNYLWQYYGAGEQQSDSTGKDDVIGGCQNGWIPGYADTTSPTFKNWKHYYEHNALAYPDGKKFFKTNTSLSSDVPDDYKNAWESCYAPNGAIRVSNGNHKHHIAEPTILHYVPRKTYGVQSDFAGGGGLGSVKIGGGWMIDHASTERGIVKRNLKMMNSRAFTTTGYELWSADTMGDWLNSGLQLRNDFWGLTLDYQEEPGTDADTAVSTGTNGGWQENDKIRYKFYATCLFDDSKQESHPALFTMYPTCTAPSDTGAWLDNPDIGSGEVLGSGSPDMYFSGVAEDGSPISGNNDASTVDNIQTGVSVYFKPIIRLKSHPPGGIAITSDGGGGWTATPDAEVLAAHDTAYGGPLTDDVDGEDKYTFGSNSRSCGNPFQHYRGGRQRYTGMRIYWSSNEDGYKELYAMFELDFEKGVRAYGMGVETSGIGSWAPWEPYVPVDSDGNRVPGHCQPGWSTDVRFTEPPKTETYYSLNSREHTTSTTAAWKTSTFIKDRVYIANYRRPSKTFWETGSQYRYTGGPASLGYYDQESGGTFVFPNMNGVDFYGNEMEPRIKSDKICISPVGQYDIFPEEEPLYEKQFGESDDGDEIIHLNTTGNKLLIFKVNSLIIVDVGDDVHAVEATHKGLGLEGRSPSGVCKTDFGVAWVNSNGCYHYDGNRIKSLSAKKIDNFIRNEEWGALPFSDADSGVDHIKSLRWSVPESFKEPNENAKYGSDDTEAEVVIPNNYPEGDVIQSLGFDPTSKKLIWMKNSGGGKGGEHTWSPWYHSGVGNPMKYKDILIYDFKTDSWALRRCSVPHYSPMSNLVNFKRKLLGMTDLFWSDPLFTSDFTDANEDGGFDTSESNNPHARYRMMQWTDNPIDVARRGPFFQHFNHQKDNYWHTNAMAISKDFTFGDAGVLKKIYRVYVTYRCKFGEPNVQIRYRVNGNNNSNFSYAFKFDSTTIMPDGTGTTDNADGALPGPTGDYAWVTSRLTPAETSQANNIYSFQLWIGQLANQRQTTVTVGGSSIYTASQGSNSGATTANLVENTGLGYVDSSFEINDITIVYRMKNIK